MKGRKWLKRLIISLGTACFIVLIVGIICQYQAERAASPNDKYMTSDGYYKAVGVPPYCVYKDVLKRHGEPMEIKEYWVRDTLFGYYLCYDCITFLCVDQGLVDGQRDKIVSDPSEILCTRFIVTSDAYTFGKNKIKVGSTKAEVDWAYRRNMTSFEVPGHGGGYIDGFWSAVRFIYDENNRVTQITFNVDCT
ncbi:MAG: hypothetical protein FWE69_04185 [Clostridiales bacterium]|nr:hypothetical protein [Clostridiales bacterium]